MWGSGVASAVAPGFAGGGACSRSFDPYRSRRGSFRLPTTTRRGLPSCGPVTFVCNSRTSGSRSGRRTSGSYCESGPASPRHYSTPGSTGFGTSGTCGCYTFIRTSGRCCERGGPATDLSGLSCCTRGSTRDSCSVRSSGLRGGSAAAATSRCRSYCAAVTAHAATRIATLAGRDCGASSDDCSGSGRCWRPIRASATSCGRLLRPSSWSCSTTETGSSSTTTVTASRRTTQTGGSTTKCSSGFTSTRTCRTPDAFASRLRHWPFRVSPIWCAARLCGTRSVQ